LNGLAKYIEFNDLLMLPDATSQEKPPKEKGECLFKPKKGPIIKCPINTLCCRTSNPAMRGCTVSAPVPVLLLR